MAAVDFTSDVGTTGNWFFWISAIVALVPAQNILLLCNCGTGTRTADLLSPRWLLLSVLLLCHAAADLPVGKLIWCRAGPRMHRVPGETHHSVVARVGQTLR